MKYYAVAAGRTTGIFTSWPAAKAQVDGFPGAVYKSFNTREQAESFLANPVLGLGRKKTAASLKPRYNGPTGSDKDWPDGTIVVYTDGSAIVNPGPGGYVAVIQKYPDGPAKELSGGYRHTTNNRMEMTAVIKALQALQGTVFPVVVHSDSRYVVDALTKGWARGWEKRGWKRSNGEPALNPDLWKQLLPLVQSMNVRFVWVRGHSGNPLNERCDELANMAARQQGNPDDME
ncbi:MAG TPA: ribonuclease HI [Desulforhopalus sp.]|nr:ribonuclease HI [Desulforhopalus sp.]